MSKGNNNNIDSGKSRKMAIILASLPGFGAFGFHKFYLGQYVKGTLFIIVTIFTFTGLPFALQLVAWASAIHYLVMDQRQFHARVIAGRGDEVDEELSRPGEGIEYKAQCFFDTGGLSASLGGASKGTVFLTDRELVLGHSRSVKSGNKLRTLWYIIYGAAVRGLGRAIPGLGLAIEGIAFVGRKLFKTATASLTIDVARDKAESIVLRLTDIDEVMLEDEDSDETYLRIRSDELPDDVWVALGNRPSKVGDEDDTIALRDELEAGIERAKSIQGDVIYCPNCDGENPSDATYCRHCEERLEDNAIGKDSEASETAGTE